MTLAVDHPSLPRRSPSSFCASKSDLQSKIFVVRSLVCPQWSYGVRDDMAESAIDEKERIEVKEVKNDSRILIIGAGLSGLSAANHLVKHGVKDFNILEARNRIGGRVISIPLGMCN